AVVEHFRGAESRMRLRPAAEPRSEAARERRHVTLDDEVEVVARLAEQCVPHRAADHVHRLARVVRRGDRLEDVREAPIRAQLVGDRVLALQASAIASISTSAPDGSAETSIVARAGGRSPTYLR